jgi:hypothetical protein
MEYSNKMQNSVAKKIFAVGSAVAMTLVSFAPLAAHAAVHAAGTNVVSSDGTVWMVMPDGTRRAYTSAGAFLSYGFNSWAQVVPASAEDLALPAGSFIPPQDGSIICSDRGTDKGTCYEISNGQKFGFTSAAVFTGLGFSFTNSMPGDVSWMTMNATLLNNTTMAHLPGTLVNNNGTVQLMGNTGLLGIPDVATFNSWGYSFGKVAPANAADKAMTQTGVMAARVAGQLSPTALVPCTSNCGVPVVSGNVNVSLASDTPAAGTLVSATTGPGQVSADLAHFNFSGTGTVTQVVVNRIGVSSDSSLNNVYLYMGNNRITDAGTFSQGKVTFSNSNGLFTANGTAEISVRVDVATNQSGITVGAQLAGFTVANGSPMTTAISGNLFTIANISNLATVQVQGTSNSAVTGPGTSINAGLTNQVLWSVPVSVGQRSVLLKYIAFKQIGSINQSAIQNLKLMVDGTQVGSSASITSNGSNTNVVVFDLSGNPFTLSTGGHTLSLNGDIVTGTSFTFEFSLQQAADAVFFDTNYGVNVPITFSNTNSIFQLVPGTGLTTINSGTVSVQLDPTFTATQFVTNSSQVVLGSWTMKAYGENVKVQNLKVLLNYFVNGVATNASTTDGFNNLAVYVNGGSVGSSQAALFQTSGANFVSTGINTFTFGTSNLFTIPAGTTVTVQVKGDSTFATTDSVNSVRADVNTPQNSLQGVTSFALSPAASLGVTYTGITLTTSSSNATLTRNTGYSSQTIGSNMTNQHIGSFVIQASSADGVRVTSLAVGLTGTFNTQGGGSLTNGVANLYIVTPAGSATPVQPSATSTFSTNFTVAANQTATIDVYADVSNATGTIVTAMAGSGVGATSNQAVTLASAGGQTITVGNGTINAPTLQTSSPVASFVIGGSTNQPAATFNFVASSGGATIQELDFNASTTIPSASGSPITSITVGGVTAPVVGASSTVTGLNIPVPTSFGGVDVPVTVNYSTVGQNGINMTGNSNATVQLVLSRVKYLSGSTTAYLPVGASFGQNLPSNTFDLVGSAPTLALVGTTNTMALGESLVGKITVSANAAGNIILTHLPITASISGGTIATTTFAAPNTVNIIDDTTGQTVSATGNSFATTTGGSITITLTSDNTIAAGSSKTYDIYVPIATITGTGANSASVALGLGSAGSLTFSDVNGGGVAITGALGTNTFIVNYPTGTVSIHN